VAHWKPMSKVKYAAYNTELEAGKINLSNLQLGMIEAVSALENECKAHGKTSRKASRLLFQAHQSLELLRSGLQDKNGSEREMAALNVQLVDHMEALRLSVAEFSRKVVHVCKGPQHIEFNSTIHARARDGSTPLHWSLYLLHPLHRVTHPLTLRSPSCATALKLSHLHRCMALVHGQCACPGLVRVIQGASCKVLVTSLHHASYKARDTRRVMQRCSPPGAGVIGSEVR